MTKYKQNETTSALYGPREVVWCSLHSLAQMFWNFPLLKSQKNNGLAKCFSLAGNWLTQILKKKKQTSLKFSTFLINCCSFTSWNILWSFPSTVVSFPPPRPPPPNLPFCQPQNHFILFHDNLLEERSICDRFSYLDIHHFENFLKSRRQLLYFMYLLVIPSLFLSSFITIIIPSIIIIF